MSRQSSNVLYVSLSAEDIDANQREMLEEVSEERYLMSAVVVDTHAIVWYLEGDPRLSVKAAAALDQATSGGEAIHVPSVCLPG